MGDVQKLACVKDCLVDHTDPANVVNPIVDKWEKRVTEMLALTLFEHKAKDMRKVMHCFFEDLKSDLLKGLSYEQKD